jgi:hypothetical protein
MALKRIMMIGISLSITKRLILRQQSGKFAILFWFISKWMIIKTQLLI